MPSLKTPSTVVSVGGGAIPPASGGSALSGALTAHVTDPVGAHAASAISYAGGGTWADGTTNPASDVETEVDKVITDLTSASGQTGAGKIYKGVSPAWKDTTTIAASQLNTWLNNVVSSLASSTPGATGAGKIGTESHSSSYGPFSTGGDGVDVDLSDLVNAVNSSFNSVVVNAGNTPYQLGPGVVTHIFINNSTGVRQVVLPQTPANYKGWRWYVYDAIGNSQTYWTQVLRYSGSTYLMNGQGGSVPSIAIGGRNYGSWVITCDGTNFFIQELQSPAYEAFEVLFGWSPYELDSRGYRDEELWVSCFLGAMTITLPRYPQYHQGQRWYIHDKIGRSVKSPLTIARHGSGTYTINGKSGNLVLLGGAYSKWTVSCDGSNFFVDEAKAPLGAPVYVPSVDASPYLLDSRPGFRDEEVFVDTSGGYKQIILPDDPTFHKGQRWYIHDQAGTSEDTNKEIRIERYAAGSTYLINGLGPPTNTYVASAYGRWVITCDGTNFFVN